jgi:hypothetical protein
MAIIRSKFSDGPWESLEDFLTSDGYTQTIQTMDAMPEGKRRMPELTLDVNGTVEMVFTFDDQAHLDLFSTTAQNMWGPSSLRPGRLETV